MTEDRRNNTDSFIVTVVPTVQDHGNELSFPLKETYIHSDCRCLKALIKKKKTIHFRNCTSKNFTSLFRIEKDKLLNVLHLK